MFRLRGKQQQAYSPTFANVLLLCCLFSSFIIIIIEATNDIDGCDIVTRRARESGSSNLVVVTIPAFAGEADMSSHHSRIFFEDCLVPRGMHIEIGVPSMARVQAAGSGDNSGGMTTTMIDIRNTKLHGGSLHIVPISSNATTIQNVYISVEGSELQGDGDVLVVNTSRPAGAHQDTSSASTFIEAVQNVTMRIKNSVIESTEGCVASIIACGVTQDATQQYDNCIVQDTTILIGGNTSMVARYLVGSVQTSQIMNTTLVVDSSNGGGASGPVHMVAGAEEVDGNVGVLTIRPPPPSAALRLHDVHIIVTNTPTLNGTTSPTVSSTLEKDRGMQLEATARRGTAAIAGVAIAHPIRADLVLSGNVTVAVVASGIPQGLLDSVGIETWRLDAVVGGHNSAVAVGGFAIVVYDEHTPSNIVVQAINGCALRLGLHSNRITTDIDIGAHSNSSRVASSLFGIALSSHSLVAAGVVVGVYDGSSIDIVMLRRTAGRNLTITSKSKQNYIASAVFGIALNAGSQWSSQGSSSSRSSFVVLNRSRVSFEFLVAGAADDSGAAVLLHLWTNGGDHVSCAVLGVAMQSDSEGKPKSTSNATMSIKDHSDFTITSTVDSSPLSNSSSGGGGSVNITAESQGSWLVCTVLGVAMQSHAFGGNIVGATNSTLLITDRSRIVVASTFRGTALVTLRTLNSGRKGTFNSGRKVASSVLGIATQSHSFAPAALGTSAHSDASLVASSVSLNAVTSNHEVASSVLGIATYSFSQSQQIDSVAISALRLLYDSNVSVVASGGGMTMNVTNTGVSAQQACAVGGVSQFTKSYSNYHRSSAFSVLHVSERGALQIFSYLAFPSTLVIQSGDGGQIASTVMGVATMCSSGAGKDVNNPGATPSRSTGSALLTVDKDSSLSIRWLTNRSQGHQVTAVIGPDLVAQSLLGIAVHLSVTATNYVSRTNEMIVGSSSHVVISALLAKQAARTSAGTRSTVAALGIHLATEEGGSYLRIVQEESGTPYHHGANIPVEIWVGAVTATVVDAVAAGSTSAAVAVGLLSTRFYEMTGANTALTFCSDGAVDPSVSSNGVTLTARPTISGFTPLIVRTWDVEQEEDTTNNHSDVSSCTQASRALRRVVETKINESWVLVEVAVPPWSLPPWDGWGHLPRPLTPTPTLLSASPTLSGNLSASTTRSSSLASVSPSHKITPSTSTTITQTQKVINAETTEPVPTVKNSTNNTTNPEEVPPKARKVTLTTSIMLADNEVAATVVLTTAGASGAVASTLGSSGGGIIVVAASSVRMLECGLAEDDPKPAVFELPIQFALYDGTMKYFAGAALAHTVLQCCFLALPIIVRRFSERTSPFRKAVPFLSFWFCGSHAYFTPSILSACSTVLNSSSDDEHAVNVAAASGCGAVIVALHLTLVVAVHRGPRQGLRVVRRGVGGSSADETSVKLEFRCSKSSGSTRTSSDEQQPNNSETNLDENDDSDSDSRSSSNTKSSNSSPDSTSLLFSAQATKDILLTLFDGCRLYEKATHRHYASIEITIYSIIAAVSGSRPQQNCNAAAAVIGVLAGLHLLYIILVRPFRTKLDTLFSIVNSGLVLLLSLTVAISVSQRDKNDASEPDAWALKIVEACLWLISVLGFIQLGVQGYWAYHVAQRREHHHHRQQSAGDSDTTSNSTSNSSSSSSDEDNTNDKGTTSEPLLQVVEMRERVATTGNTVANPLSA